MPSNNKYYNKKDLIKKWNHDKNNSNKSTDDEKTSHSPNCHVKPSISVLLHQTQSNQSNHLPYSSNHQTQTNSNCSRINYPETSEPIPNSDISNKRLQNQLIEELKKKRKSTRLSIIHHKRLFGCIL